MLDFLIGNDFLSTLIAFAIVLIPAVIVHELGHFLAAKAAGITVLEFGIGFPPRVMRLFTWGETEFTLNWIPLGGFVRPLGEDLVRPLGDEATEQDRQQVLAKHAQEDTAPVSLSEREALARRGVYRTMSVNEARPFPRMVFFVAGALANFIFAFALFAMIALIGIPSEVGGRVGLLNIPEDSALRAIGLQNGDLIETINNRYFVNSGEFVSLLAELRGQEAVLRVARSDTGAPRTVGPFVVTDDLLNEVTVARNYVLVTGVSEESPAENVLMVGDLIVSVNGSSLASVTSPITALQEISTLYAGEEITLSVLRDGHIIDNITLTPRENPPANTGRIGITIQLGFANSNWLAFTNGRIQVHNAPQPLGMSLQYGINRTAYILEQIAAFPARLVRGATVPEERRIVSIVGVSQMGGQFLQDSIEEDQPVVILDYIALISIALGITNLLPIPALDGGRVLFVLIEIIRGRPVSPEREGMVHLAGLVFLLFLGMIVIINDLANPITSLLP